MKNLRGLGWKATFAALCAAGWYYSLRPAVDINLEAFEAQGAAHSEAMLKLAVISVVGAAVLAHAAFWKGISWYTRAIAVFLFLGCVAFNLSNAIGNSANLIDQSREKAEAQGTQVDRREEKRTRLKAERQTQFDIAGDASAESFQADIETRRVKDARLWESTGGCLQDRIKQTNERTFCADLAKLEKKRAAAQRRAEIDADIDGIDSQSTAKEKPQNESFAVNISKFAGMWGFTVKKETVATARPWQIAITAELFAALFPIVWTSLLVAIMFPAGRKPEVEPEKVDAVEHKPDPVPSIALPAIPHVAAEMTAPAAPAAPVHIEAAPKAMEAAIEPEPEEEATPRTFPPRRPRLIASEAAPFGNVAEILREALETTTRGKLELEHVLRAYSEACTRQGKRPVSQDRFVDDLTAFCRDADIAMTGDDAGIYLLKVRLKKSGKRVNA